MTAPEAPMQPFDVALFDLDGVIRHFDPGHREAVERRHGVETGSIARHAFDPALLDRAITGAITTSAWIEAIGVAIGSHAAAKDWSSSRGGLDPSMLEFLGELRALGVRVAVLTNGTTEVTGEFTTLGLLDHVDAAFNTADIGYAKPDPRAFAHVCAAMGVTPEAVFFTDDTHTKLTGAQTLGMTTHHYTGLADLQTRLAALGVLD